MRYHFRTTLIAIFRYATTLKTSLHTGRFENRIVVEEKHVMQGVWGFFGQLNKVRREEQEGEASQYVWLEFDISSTSTCKHDQHDVL